MDSNQKKTAEKVENMLLRHVPSQVPFNCTKKSYERMLLHGKLFDRGPRSLWACAKTGQRIHAKVNWRTIWNRDGSLNATHVPVAILFCSGCDQKPQVTSEDPIWADEVQTLAL